MGFDTVPCTYNKVLQLEDQYKSSYQQRQPGGGGSIVFMQKGKVATAALAATAASSEKKLPHPVPGQKEDKGKMLANSPGKKNCINCGSDNHWVVNCPDLTAPQRNEVAGMAHVSQSATKKLKESVFYKSINPCVVATCKTLDPSLLYLDSRSSFHQVFMEEHLDNLRLASATLRANCNDGTNYATKKSGTVTYSTYG
jgi:hypothetical protein